jgi:plasmid stabilization system protein ParE
MKLVFSSSAEGDLEEIGSYIAKDDPERAVTFIKGLF